MTGMETKLKHMGRGKRNGRGAAKNKNMGGGQRNYPFVK